MKSNPNNRFYFLDSLKGLMLIILTFNHVSANSIHWLTFETFGFFGGAEGYVMITGFLVGNVYGKISYSRTLLAKKTQDKAFTIALFWLVIIFGAEILSHSIGGHPFRDLSLFRQFPINILGNNEILGLYFTLFLLIFPILRLLEKGKRALLLTISISAYLFGYYPELYRKLGFLHSEIGDAFVQIVYFLRGNLPTPFSDFEQNYQYAGFSLIFWQLLFVIAVSIGFYRRKTGEFNVLNALWVLPVTASVCIVFLIFRYSSTASELIPSLFLKKEMLGIARLSNVLVFSLLIYSITTRIHTLPRIKSLEIMGRNSLSVYTFQTLIVFGFINPRFDEKGSTLSSAALLSALCASLFLIAQISDKKHATKIIERMQLKQRLGIPKQLDWKRKISLTIVFILAVAFSINLIRLREDFPLTAASMFGRYVNGKTNLISVRLYTDAVQDLNEIDFTQHKLNKRILLYSIYCPDESNTPYYNPNCFEENYQTRMGRWFDHLSEHYYKVHSKLPETFILTLCSVNTGPDDLIHQLTYDCSTAELSIWNHE